MSISPTDANRSASSSSYHDFSRSPSSDDGFPHEARGSPDHQISGDRHRKFGSAQTSVEESLANLSIANSDLGAAVAGDSCDTPGNVTELCMADAKIDSCGENSETYFLSQASHRGVASCGHLNGKVSAATSSLHSDHLLAGSNILQSNATHSATRKNQVVNGNHLLNFYYDPICRQPPKMPPRRRKQKVRPYNKDLFLQANYKFVVLDSGNSLIESTDPDRMLQWEDIVCVRYSSTSPVQCPICLENPLCPQITSCGHIYCFPCILRYMLMGEDDRRGECWKKCPLCFMMLSLKDFYTIYIDNVKQHGVGDLASFTLLTRSKDSLVPLQKSQQDCDLFSKFIVTKDVELSVQEVKLSLNDWLSKVESGLVDDLEKLPYVCVALEQLEQRVNRLSEVQTLNRNPLSKLQDLNLKASYTTNRIKPHALSSSTNSDNAYSETHKRLAGTEFMGHKDESGKFYSLEKLGGDGSFAPPVTSESFDSLEEVLFSHEEDRGLQRPSSSCQDSKEIDSYVFYQAADGQHLILHPLNMKCLLHHYSCYDLLPPRISGRILHLETVTQSEAMRRRYRFLSHFSLTTTFQLCEIDLSDILPSDALSPFMDEIKKREKQRKRLAKKEQEEKAQAEGVALYTRSIPADHGLSSGKDATFSLDDFEVLGTHSVPSTSPPVAGEKKLFSAVTRLGFAAAHDSPSLRAQESSGFSNSKEEAGKASSIMGPSIATSSFASVVSMPKSTGSAEAPKVNEFGRKGKKPTRVLLSTSGGRRY